MSERLAFERMGVRLYEALLNKCRTPGESALGRRARALLMINRVITEFGGDPTVLSPSTDVAGVASMGIMQVLTDPRSSLTQCLQVKAEFENALVNEEEHLVNARRA